MIHQPVPAVLPARSPTRTGGDGYLQVRKVIGGSQCRDTRAGTKPAQIADAQAHRQCRVGLRQHIRRRTRRGRSNRTACRCRPWCNLCVGYAVADQSLSVDRFAAHRNRSTRRFMMMPRCFACPMRLHYSPTVSSRSDSSMYSARRLRLSGSTGSPAAGVLAENAGNWHALNRERRSPLERSSCSRMHCCSMLRMDRSTRHIAWDHAIVSRRWL